MYTVRMKRFQSTRCPWVILFVFCAVAPVAQAGGGPQNVLVVVNDNSLESLELGKYYQQQRGIPERNVFHVRTSTANDITVSSFSNEIRMPVVAYITTAFPSNQIDYVVFSKDIPYRVFAGNATTNANSLTSAMFYDYRTGFYSCDLPSSSRQDYYETEREFARGGAPSSNRYILCALLAPTNLAQAKIAVSRAVSADYTQPTATVYLCHTPDIRNARWPQYENTEFLLRFLDTPEQVQIVEAFISGQTNVMGYMAGAQGIADLTDNVFQPGAIGDHLTSYGGFLYDPDPGHMSVVEWLKAGCAGSYGTVIEPCLYTNKFPLSRVHYWYGRGFSLGEAYFMAVRNPYQGVVVGDPLCQPYAVQPHLSVAGITSNQVVTGSVTLVVTSLAVSASRPVDQIDLYMDGAWRVTLTNVAPTRFNTVSAAIKGITRTYTNGLGDSLYTVASGLASAINKAPPIGVTAKAYGDRIEVVQNTKGTTGAWMSVSATSATGSAGRVTVFARTPFTNFLETIYRAQKQMMLTGTVMAGDVMRTTVTRSDGVAVTNMVTAGSADTRYTLFTNLVGMVNADSHLQSSGGCEGKWVAYLIDTDEAFVVARTNTWEGYNMTLRFEVVPTLGSGLEAVDWTSNFVDNADVLSARATVFLSEGATILSAGYSLATTNLSDGPHELTAVAYEGTAVRTQGRMTIPFVVDNNAVECAITNPPAGATYLLGEVATARIQAPSATSVEFYVEGKMLALTNAEPYVFSFAVTNYGVGTVNMQAKAFASGAGSALSSNVSVTILPDYDFDSLDDNWEIRHWGSITVTGGTNDWDGDNVSNRDEYTADTQPTNDASFFRVSRIGQINNQAQIEYVSSTARQYRLHYRDTSLLEGLWLESSNWLWGSAGVTTQLDDGTAMPLPTNAYRFYRVRAHRP